MQQERIEFLKRSWMEDITLICTWATSQHMQNKKNKQVMSLCKVPITLKITVILQLYFGEINK